MFQAGNVLDMQLVQASNDVYMWVVSHYTTGTHAAGAGII